MPSKKSLLIQEMEKYHFYLDISNLFSCNVNVGRLTLKTTNWLHIACHNGKTF